MTAVAVVLAAAATGDTGDSVPAWATALLVAGAGIAGGLLVAFFQGQSQKREQWRTRLIQAADEFLQAVAAAEQALDAVLQDAYRTAGGVLEDQTLLSKEGSRLLRVAEPLVNEARNRVSRVHLLFGVQSNAGAAAGRVVQALDASFFALEGEPDYPFTDADRSHQQLLASRAATLEFVQAAQRSAVKGKPKTARG